MRKRWNLFSIIGLCALVLLTLIVLVLVFYPASKNISGNVFGDQKVQETSSEDSTQSNLDYDGYIIEYQEDPVVVQEKNIEESGKSRDEAQKEGKKQRDDLVVFNRALSASEVRQIYNDGKNGKGVC